MEKKNGISGFRGKRVLFIKILGLLMALSLLTVLIFGIFINKLVLNNQKERIDELNLKQLQRISSDVELIFDLLAQGMTRSMWSDDFIDLMITPGQHNADLAHRVIKVLEDQVSENDLVRKSYLYLPSSDEVYVYSGTYTALEYLGDREMIRNYLAVRENGRDPDAASEWRVVLYNRRIFLASDFCLPNFVGVMFYEINRQSLYHVIQAENEDFNTTIYVYDAMGNLLFDYMAGGLQPSDFSRPELFVTDEDDNRSGSYYMTLSPQIGWRYLVRVNPAERSVSAGTVLGLLLPCILFYIAASLMFSVYISQSVYSPINRLMQITTDPKRREKRQKPGKVANEVDFLELVWLDSLEQNEQHQELMGHISEDILEQMLRGILTGKSQSAETLAATLKTIDRSELIEGYYVVLVLEIFGEEDEKHTMVEQELYQRSLMNILNRVEEEEMTVLALPMELMQVAVILHFAGNISAFQIREMAGRLENRVRQEVKNLPYQVEVGTGNTCNELTAVQQSYYEAAEHVRYRKYKEQVPENESMDNVSSEEFYYLKLARHSYSLAESGKLSEALAGSRSLLEEIQKREANPGVCWQHLVDDMMEKLISCRISQEEINTAGVLQCLEEVQKAKDRQAAEPFMTEFYRTSLPLIWESSRKSNNHYVQKTKEYIAEHYAEGTLSLQEISGALGITNSYLSSIFTEGAGTGLNTWMNEYRIQQAKRFMDETNLNISEIGYKCGFNSAQSFTRVFKKHTGMSPKSYRDMHHLGRSS